MKITEVRIRTVTSDKLKAYASVIFDECFVITDIKVIEGPKGLFLSMPSKKKRDGKFRDIAHPLNTDFRKYMEDAVLDEYKKALESPQEPQPAPEEEAN
ncbi:MAG TPA: septation regulator SpoVG [Acidobacteriota bacterium]|jgi:stage V sporulation protein G|nr:septation regulator SpoVG [Acidobacteriota bacterium]HNT17969.1 septation regulator SpoVG [Acidobacteriota bacterium]HPA27793.1 septation regulator SpoVG [Acidobacteriota bacterium]HQO18936.1 septation regulator SpoVG [Acidobacteriota bacterium]HQQ46404.1 septation regulator SpoVG [Acidobacteriota bacterium]